MAQKKKKKKRKLTPFGRFLKGCYLTIMILSALIVTGYTVWSLTIKAPTIEQPPAPTVSTEQPSDDPDTPDIDESQTSPTPALQRKDRFYTFLLVAQDQVSSSTDTIIVASYDAVNHRASLVSIPRDTLVDRRVGPYRYHKINGAYSNAEVSKPGSGLGELKAAVSQLLGIPIDYHVMVDVPSFIRIVDAVGGVDFEVPVKMDYDAPDQNLHIHYEPKMYYGLSGKQVMEIARCRKNTIWSKDGSTYELYDAYPDAEIGRTRTQQALMKAIAKKLVSWGSITKVESFLQIFNESVTTNLSLPDMLFFASDAFSNDALSTLATATFPGDGDVRYRGISYCYQYDIPGSLEIINTMLSPYATPVTEDMVHMLQVK